ncbi:unnamed protein product, partial [Heterosigma akashiwo]
MRIILITCQTAALLMLFAQTCKGFQRTSIISNTLLTIQAPKKNSNALFPQRLVARYLVNDVMEDQTNLLGGALRPCSTAPMTGFYRNGYCACGPGDYGVHSVCASLTEEFLAYTKGRGNDLSTPRPEFGFPGLKPGDRWCLCASRWK